MTKGNLVGSNDQYAQYGSTVVPGSCSKCQSGGKKHNKHKKQKGGDFFGDLFGVQRNVSSNNEPTTPTRTPPSTPQSVAPSAPQRTPLSERERMERRAQRRNVVASGDLRRRIFGDGDSDNDNNNTSGSVDLRTGGKKRTKNHSKKHSKHHGKKHGKKHTRKHKKHSKKNTRKQSGGAPGYGYVSGDSNELLRGSYAPIEHVNSSKDCGKVQQGGKKQTKRHNKKHGKKHGKTSKHNKKSRKSHSLKRDQKGGSGYHQYGSNAGYSRGYTHDLNSSVGGLAERVAYSTCSK